jgi:NADPH:quinone reductase-like Zn-dependent oxidoreductase
MRGLFYERYGLEAIRLRDDLPLPAQPILSQVRIQVKAAGLNQADVKIAKGYVSMFTSIKVPGLDVAGEVVAIGPAVTRFKVGDSVYGSTDFRQGGTFAEVVLVDEQYLSHIPKGLSFSEAASIPLVSELALQALKAANVQPGESVLILGGSGGTGSAAIQLARAMGARVTATCSGGNSEFCKSLGADKTIDYTMENFGERAGEFDIVVDTVGKAEHFTQAKSALKRRGRFVSTAYDHDGPMSVGQIFVFAATIIYRLCSSFFSSISFSNVNASSSHILLEEISKFYSDGKFKPVIEAEYKLEQFREAFLRQESNRTRGKSVLVLTLN